jgi:hypothetical protein
LLTIIIPFQFESIQLAFGKGTLPFLFESILQDDLVNDLTAENASPSEKFLTNAVEFFEYHCSAASITLHDEPPFAELAELSAIIIPIGIFS